MLVDPEAAREARLDDAPVLPVKTALRHSTCPHCLGLIEPGQAIACLPKQTRYGHVACCEFEMDLRTDPVATRKREQAEWQRRMVDYRQVRVPPAHKRKRRKAVA